MIGPPRRARVLLTLFAVAALVAGCGTGGDGDNGRAADPAPSSQPSTGASDAVTRLPTIEAACPLLAADEVFDVLGGTANTQLEGTEGPVDTSEGQPEYVCTYGRDGALALEFRVLVSPGMAGSGRDIIDAIGADSGLETEFVGGLGDAAVTYTGDGVRLLATSVAYEQEQRTVIFATPAIVPKEKLIELATLVLRRV